MDVLSGKGYERQVMRYLAEREKGIAFELDVNIKDTSGSYFRQIDVWLPRAREIIECKHHSRPVGIAVIDELIGTIDDVGASGGRVFSHAGFSSLALVRAAKVGIECVPLPFEEWVEEFSRPTGGGCYFGDYIDLCAASTPECNSFGRINYVDSEENGSPICVGYSVDWGNFKMLGFVAYVILSHYMGKPPTDDAIDGFVDEYRDRFEAGQNWTINEREVWHFAIAA